MADGYYLTEKDRAIVAAVVDELAALRVGRGSSNYLTEPVAGSPEVYVAMPGDKVPAAEGTAPGEMECTVHKYEEGSFVEVTIGGTPKSLTAYNVYEVELPETLQIIVRSKYGKWLYVHSGLDSTEEPPPPGSGSGSDKQAIVRIQGPNGTEYRGWFCTEEPLPSFRMEICVPIGRGDWNVVKSRAQVEVEIPEVFRQCVFQGTIQAVSAMCAGGPAMATAEASAGLLRADIARVPLLAPRPRFVVVQIKATRSDIYEDGVPPDPNPYHTEEEWLANIAFWAKAKANPQT